jgi:hypothetical protein
MPAATRMPPGKAAMVKSTAPVGRPAGASPGKGATGLPARQAPAPAATTKRPFGMFGTLGKVQGPSGGGNWVKDGVYYVMVNKFVADESKQQRGEFCAAEMTILELISGYETSSSVGERISNVFMANTPNNMGVINLKGFLGACTGMDPNATTEGLPGYASGEAWQEAAEKAAEGDGTLLAGTILELTAMTIKTKAQKDFTKVTYRAVDEETAAQVIASLNTK